VGALLIYYFVPALYCNVSGLHLIPKRSQRLWVIAAGIYWQLPVGTLALLAWFVVEPYTLLSDVAFIFFLGSVLDIVFNANPLIKLDGYYFLSQWLRLPNLMDRSRAYWRGAWRRLVTGEPEATAAQQSRRERTIYAVFGRLSFLYTVTLIIFILIDVGEYLTDSFYLLGLLLTAGLALVYAREPLKRLVSAAASMIARRFETMRGLENKNTSSESEAKRPRWQRQLVPATILLRTLRVKRRWLPGRVLSGDARRVGIGGGFAPGAAGRSRLSTGSGAKAQWPGVDAAKRAGGGRDALDHFGDCAERRPRAAGSGAHRSSATAHEHGNGNDAVTLRCQSRAVADGAARS
jgi:hypothetical protein